MMTLILLLTANLVSQTPANPASDAARTMYPEHERNIITAFKQMPEAKYAFKPTPELMSFGELAWHIASANFYYCRALSAAPPPAYSRLKGTEPKDTLVQTLEASFAYCRAAVERITDAELGQAVPIPQGKSSTRALVLLQLVSGMDHHYGQTASYLRLNGLVPPSASGK